MMKKIFKFSVGVVAALSLIVPSAALFADNASSTEDGNQINFHSGKMGQGGGMMMPLEKVKDKANQEIDRRIEQLQKLGDRIAQMQRISDVQKANMAEFIKKQLDALTTLKTEIDANTDVTTLKNSVHSITGSYRIFALVMPQGRILAAGDRITTIAQMLTDLGTKLSDRITAAPSSVDVAALNTLLSDMNAKIADAKAQQVAAVALLAPLTPDNGDMTKMKSNMQALKDARDKIKTAEEDLRAARKDSREIIVALTGEKTGQHDDEGTTTASTTSEH